MTSVRTTPTSSFLIRFFVTPFFPLLVIASALDGPAVIGDLQNCGIITTVGQSQIDHLGDSSPSLRRSGDQPTLQLTIQRENTQTTIALQNPSRPKAVS